MASKWYRRIVAGAALVAAAGCGGPQHPIAGHVVRDGKPVDQGVVQFAPDLDKGNDGPTATVLLQGGRFTSRDSKTPVKTGAYKVTVIVPHPDGGERPSQERTVRIDNPPEGTPDLTFDLTRKPKAKSNAEQDGN